MALEVKLPELGEGIEAGDVVSITVSKGDFVKEGQTLCELETDKALVEVPSNGRGTVEEVRISEGDRVSVGDVLVVLAGGEPQDSRKDEKPEKTSADEKPAGDEESKQDEQPDKQSAQAESESKEEKESSSAQAKEPKPGQNKADADKADADKADADKTAKQPERRLPEIPKTGEAEKVAARHPGDLPINPDDVPPAAGPATRRLARELGVDLRLVKGSGRGGRINKEDVRAYIRDSLNNFEDAATAGCPLHQTELPDFGQWGEVEREKINKVRETTARHLASSWINTPQVTQYDRADVTELEEMRQRFKGEAKERDSRLTMTVLLIKAAVNALKEHPRFNASLDLPRRELVYKRYYHIGMAVDTPRGLLVPVIRDADEKDIWQLGRELGEIAARAREGKVDISELRGASFSISNQGGIGGLEFTPLVNSPEAAILGIGEARLEPRYVESGELEPRLMMPLALSYDHRICDGADAARFITNLRRSLEDPERLLLGL